MTAEKALLTGFIKQGSHSFLVRDLAVLTHVCTRPLNAHTALIAERDHADPTQPATDVRPNAGLMKQSSDSLLLFVRYVHAYQSYVWNHAVSDRLDRYGTRLVVGDLVVRHEATSEDQTSAASRGRGPLANVEAVHVINQADIDSERFSIYDVVMPTPGHEIQYPAPMEQKYQV